MNSASQAKDIIVLLIPLIVVQLALQIAALVNLFKRENSLIRWNNKLPWILIVLFINIIGPISYFVFGRIEGEPDAGSGD